MPKLSKIEKEKLYAEMFKRMYNEVLEVIILHQKLIDNSEDLNINDFQPRIMSVSFRIAATLVANTKFKTKGDKKKLIEHVKNSFSECLPKIVKDIELANKN